MPAPLAYWRFCLLGAACSLAALFAGCSNRSEDCAWTGACRRPEGGGSGAPSAAGAGGADGAAGAGGAGGARPCPRDSVAPGCIDEDHAVFVAASATADGDGTRRAPFASIREGLEAAKRGSKRVYVCADGGDYAEALVIGAEYDGIGLFGGFACSDWTYSEALHARVTSPSSTGLVIEDLTQGLVIENFEIVASDAAGASEDGGGHSSFGLVARRAQNTILRRVRIRAGDAASGAPGTDGTTGADGTLSGADQFGRAPDCTRTTTALLGGVPTAAVCGSAGGLGGTARSDAALPGGHGEPGAPQTNLIIPEGQEARNGGIGAATAGVAGDDGRAGRNGLNGAPGSAAAALGTFTAEGYVPAQGGSGAAGSPGQGGGGGGASRASATCTGASGGAGGQGGCGGGGGRGGGGGGASVGVLSWNSMLTFDACEIVAGRGGQAGQGGAASLGGRGQAGGSGGDANATVAAGGQGGRGGNGGLGGPGAGGSGGPSLGIVFAGTAPVRNRDTQTTLGEPGGGGESGASLAEVAPDGVDGMAAELHEVLLSAD